MLEGMVSDPFLVNKPASNEFKSISLCSTPLLESPVQQGEHPILREEQSYLYHRSSNHTAQYPVLSKRFMIMVLNLEYW
jgi:hypothetical protein